MASSDDEKASNASEQPVEMVQTETVIKRPATAEQADEEATNPAKRPRHRTSRAAIDLADEATFRPCKPKSVESVQK